MKVGDEAFNQAWSSLMAQLGRISNEPLVSCKDCGEKTIKIRNPIFELSGLCPSCFKQRTGKMGAVEENEETGRPATTMLDLINAKMSEEGQAGDQQRRDLQ